MGAQRVQLIQQFARFPESGTVKTRLQVAMSAAEACAVHEELMLHTAQSISSLRDTACELWLDRSAGHATVSAALALGMRGPFLQAGADLGERMASALLAGLERADAVVLVGSDCPGIDAAYLRKAFNRLQGSDVVLGPAEDGGFVLLGCRRFVPRALSNISWGCETALEATLSRLAQAGLSTTLLDPRYDIDTPEDLQRWRAATASGVSRNPIV